MAQTADDEPPQPRSGIGRSIARSRRSSLYVRVVVVNASLLLVGLLLLVSTPVTVSAPASPRQVLVLVAAVIVLVAANAALVRVSFTGLATLVYRMQTLDVLRPRERLPEMGGAETRALIAGFNTMLDRLEAERRESTGRTVARLEDERRRISRELHDEVGQRMTGILLKLALIRDEAPDVLQSRVVAVQDEARAVMDEVGTLAWRIRPAVLEHLGLLSAIAALTGSLDGHGPARVETSLPHRLPPMSDAAELAIYRIAQEALTNALRHACATVITVRMRVHDNDVVLQVADDGCTPPEAGDDGPGLRGMRERALLIGGRLTVQANQPHGLRIELAVPTGHPGD